MPNQITATLSAAPTTGAADATSSGLNSVTGLTHTVTTARMSGDVGTSVLTSAVNGAATFRIGPTTGATAPFADDAYCTIKFKVRARVELVGSLPTDNTINGWQLLDENGPGFIVYLTNVYSGFRFYLQQFSSGADYQPIFDPIPYGEWLEFELRMKKSATGIAELFLNGAIVSTVTGDFSALGANCNFSWPAVTGIAWEFAGPFTQDSGTDSTITLRSDLDTSLDEITRYYVPYGDSRIHPDGTTSGRDAVVTTVSGSPSYSYQAVSSSGNNCRQTFVTVTGSGAVERTEYQGELDFRDGWAGIYFPMLYLPSGTTSTFTIWQDSTLLQTLTIGSDAIALNGVTQATFTAASRNALAILVGQNGELDLIVADQTTTSVAAPYVFTVSLPNWRSGLFSPPNKWRFQTTLGTSGFQRCGAAMFNVLRITGVDSMVHGAATATPIGSPAYQVGTNITSGVFLSEALAIPGVKPFNFARSCGRQCGFNLGRSGQTYAQWITNVMTPLGVIRGGMKLAIYEGGINDIAAVTTLANAKTAVDAIASYDAAVLAWTSAKPGRRAVIGSIIERTLPAHWSAGSPPSNAVTGVRLAAIRQANRNRARIFAPTVGSRASFIDVGAAIRWENHAAMIDLTNPPHFTGAGSQLYFSTFSDAETAIPQPPAPVTYRRKVQMAFVR